MTIENALQKIGEIGIVPVIRADSGDDACQAVAAICDGGIPIVEITMTVPGAAGVIRRVVAQYGQQVLTGAGTVLTADQANECLDAGAQFLVSPGLSPAVLRVARDRSALAIPGALTPTEVMAARSEGAVVTKIFPCGNVGGPKYIKALKGPFPGLKLIPTGGVGLANVRDYLSAGAFALGIGTDLVDIAELRKNGQRRIVEAARALVDAVVQARGV